MSNGKISRRANIFEFPSYRYYYNLISKKQNEGKRIYNLFQMEPNKLILEFKEESNEDDLINTFIKIYNIPDKFKVLAFPGTISALNTIFFTFLDTNDEILTPEPLFYNLKVSSEISQVRLRVIKTYYYNNFSIPSRDFVEPLINPRVKCIFITNPQFFTGNLYSEEEIERIIFLSNTYRIPLIFDETFSFSIFENVVFHSLMEMRLGHESFFILNRLIEFCSGINIVFVITTPLIYEVLKRFREEFCPLNKIITSAGKNFLVRFFSNIQNIKKNISENADFFYRKVISKDFSIIRPFSGPCILMKIPDDADRFMNYMLEIFNENNSSVFAMPMTEFFIEKDKGKELLAVKIMNLKREEIEEGIKLLKSGMANYLKEVQ